MTRLVESVAPVEIVNDSLMVISVDIARACKERRIEKIGAQTPALVPSFSSAFPHIREVHELVRECIAKFSLVSAYDLYYHNIDSDRIWASDVVFIDSGVYEYDVSRGAKDWKSWSPSLHRKTIGSLQPLAKVVLISYDSIRPVPQQMHSGLDLVSAYPNYAHAFICKSASGCLGEADVKNLAQTGDELKSFDILGFTEKELGDSLLKRCRILSMIRECLDSLKLDIPIHVFGCLDPLSIIPYFLCGADIFDGLAWLRQAFYNDVAVYVNNYYLISKCWSESDSSIRERAFVFNLKKLDDLSSKMRHFTRDHDLTVFRLDAELLNEVKALTSQAGIDY